MTAIQPLCASQRLLPGPGSRPADRPAAKDAPAEPAPVRAGGAPSGAWAAWRATAAAGCAIQMATRQPRGLKADPSERARYGRAYARAAAGGQPRAGLLLEESA